MKAISLKSLTNLNSIQFRFLKGKLPLELYQQMSKLEDLRRIKFWDLAKDSGLENLKLCKNLKVSICWL